MSHKNLDKQGRWRNKTIAFRLSDEENLLLEKMVKVTGLTKQDYIIHKLLDREVIVQGNPRVYKALKGQFIEILEQLKQIENSQEVNKDLLDLIYFISKIVAGLKEEMKNV